MGDSPKTKNSATDDKNHGGENAYIAKRRYSGKDLNKAFNDFLHIRDYDKKLLDKYQDALLMGDEQFSQVFYKYLLASPATAKVLSNYQAFGGKIEHLVKKQLDHLSDLLSGETSSESAARMERVGQIHYMHDIEPVWIMGAYLLYLDHLQIVIRNNPNIEESQRNALEDSVTKLLFRDMGLLLEGYWNASLNELEQEKNKVTQLQNQVTSLLSNIPQLLWSVDVSNNQSIYVSPNIDNICNRDIQMPIPCMNWTLEEDRQQVRLAWDKTLEGNITEVESRVSTPDGEIRWFRRVFHPYTDKNGKVVRIDGIMEDSTDAKRVIERLHNLATTDSLTGLLNRALLLDRLKQAIALSKRSSDQEVVLILMDLDHFKEINDTLGHPAGDAVLIMAAKRLSSALRESDTLARLGGDEFAILTIDSDGRKIAACIADKVLDCLSKPFHYNDNELYLGASMGIAIYPEHGLDMDTLMSRADVAMYASKRRNLGYLFYEADSDPNTQERLQLAGDLRHAIAENQLELYYQPKIELKTGKLTGLEALIRWNHPEHGTLLPDQFLSIAERSGIIKPITDWVLVEAAKQCQTLQKKGLDLSLAVNISGRVFQDSSLFHRIKQVVESHGLGPNSLEIEITENELMSDLSHVSSMLRDLTDMGISIAIDDFGTGYSSLSYLKELPLQTLKIDKSFVLNMTKDENDAVIVRSIIDLAHNMGCKVVAEGIENEETREMLTRLHCDSAQGYHLGRPMAVPELNNWLVSTGHLG